MLNVHIRAAPAIAPEETVSDTITTLMEGLESYLEEINGYRTMCLKHEATTAVSAEKGAVRLTRYCRHDTAVLTQLRSAAKGLPGWKESPYWLGDGKSWQTLTQRLTKEKGEDVAAKPLITRSISWDGLPMLLRVRLETAGQLVEVELLLLPFTAVLPQLPLRLVASVLRCHEHLLPLWLATACSCQKKDQSLTIRQYLARTMPQNLYASQCIFPESAAS